MSAQHDGLDLLDALDRAVDGAEVLIAGVRSDQWTVPTPCDGWSVRDLLTHLVGGQDTVAALLDGREPPDPASDPLGTDPVAAHRRSAEALRAAAGRPGALNQDVTVPAGTLPAPIVLHLRTVELLVHGWDLARATGQATTSLPAAVAEQEIVFSRRQLEHVPPERRPFAEPRPVEVDAPAVDRLAALLGRDPGAL